MLVEPWWIEPNCSPDARGKPGDLRRVGVAERFEDGVHDAVWNSGVVERGPPNDRMLGGDHSRKLRHDPVSLSYSTRIRGKGRIIRTPCKMCRGQGRVEGERNLEIKIPAGVETGSRLRVAGEGESGVGGGPSGDLYVVIHVKEHESFERQGANLYSAVPVSFAQAALGAEIKVKTLDGEEDLKIPAGTQTGTVFRLKNHGMPNLSGRGKGDLFVAVSLVTPKTLTKEQRKLLEQLAEVEDKDFQDESFMDKVRNIFG